MRRTRPWIAASFVIATGSMFGCAQVIGLDPGEPRDDGGVEDAAPADGRAPPPDAPAADADGGVIVDGSGDAGCPDGSHLCGSTCAPNDDPAFGCGAGDCQACTGPFVRDGGASCAAGKCAYECEPGHLDCTSSPGCETTVDNANCTGCGMACPSQQVCTGTPPACENSCAGGETLCDGGCFDVDASVTNCGTCGHVCTTSMSNAEPICVNDHCETQCVAGALTCTDNTCAICTAQTNMSATSCTASTCSWTCMAPFQSCAGTSTCDCNMMYNTCTGGQCIPKDAGTGDSGSWDSGGADACADGGITSGSICFSGEICCDGTPCMTAAAGDATTSGTCP